MTEISKEWCINMAKQEEGDIGAGKLAIDPTADNFHNLPLSESFERVAKVAEERQEFNEQMALNDRGAQVNTIEELRAANERWVIAFKQAEADATGRIEALQADKVKLREALRVYAGPMEWTQEGGWGMFPVWADGYPGGVYLDDNTLDFGEAARAALQETDETFTRSGDT